MPETQTDRQLLNQKDTHKIQTERDTQRDKDEQLLNKKDTHKI